MFRGLACSQAGAGDSVGAVAGLAKDFVIVHNEIQTLRKEVIGMKKELAGLSSTQSEHLAALQSGKRSNSMVRYCRTVLRFELHQADGTCLCGIRSALQFWLLSSWLSQVCSYQCGTRESEHSLGRPLLSQTEQRLQWCEKDAWCGPRCRILQPRTSCGRIFRTTTVANVLPEPARVPHRATRCCAALASSHV